MTADGLTMQERQLTEMLQRVTPEPPRGLTADDVGARLARQARPRLRSPNGGRTRRWAPVLAASSVFVAISVSAGAVIGLTGHHGQAAGPLAAGPAASLSASPARVPAPAPAQALAGRRVAPKPVADGIWGAELISQRKPAFTPDSLAQGADSLYALAPGYLDRIDPATGRVVAQAMDPAAGQVVDLAGDQAPATEPPVVAGDTVWLVSSYAGSGVVLAGFDGQTLASLGSVTVPVTGQLSGTPAGVLASGSGGDLYLAAGDSVAVIDPHSRQLIRRIHVSAGPVSSVAVAPGGTRLYVSTGALELVSFDPATGALTGSSSVAGVGTGGGNLVATAGGVWGTAGTGLAEWTWFAPAANLTQLVRVTQGVGAGADSVPAVSHAAVWIGGTQMLECANPDTGQLLASVAIPADDGVLEHFGTITWTGGHAYASYDDQRARLSGIARLTPPVACTT